MFRINNIFIVNFEHISHLVLVFLLTLNMKLPAGFIFFVSGHPLSTLAKFSEKLTFLTP